VDLYHVDLAAIVAIWMAGSILLIFALALAADSGVRRDRMKTTTLFRLNESLERSYY
jgi:hypothetical protein